MEIFFYKFINFSFRKTVCIIGFYVSLGEELDLLELLKSFGLDMMNVASALGVDIHTLNNMNQRELIGLLTQQVN